MILARGEHDPKHVRTLAREKFKLVRDGDHRGRITQRIGEMGSRYDDDVGAVLPDAMHYTEAASTVLGSLHEILP
jgi:hypothetical protein